MSETYTITLTREQREKLEELTMRLNNLRGMFLIRDEVVYESLERLADRSTELGYETCEMISEVILDPSYKQDAKGKK